MNKASKWKAQDTSVPMDLDDYVKVYYDDEQVVHINLDVPVNAGGADQVAWILVTAVSIIADIMEQETLIPRQLLYAKMLAIRAQADIAASMKRERTSKR